MWKEYSLPVSVKEALEILQANRGKARIIAGGTDLIIDLKEGAKQVECLVDISRLKELGSIERDGDIIKVGALVTHSQVATSELIRERAPMLAEAASLLGSPQIRNRGTLAGNVINAQPAADTAVPLVALEAQVEIVGPNGSRRVPIEKMYRDLGVSHVDSTREIVTAIYFEGLRDNQGSAFVRLAQRKALALPMLNVAVIATVQDSRFQDVRIAIAPVAPMPLRSRKAEAALFGKSVSPEAIEAAAEIAEDEAQPRDSALRGSAEYRKEMVRVLVRRAIEQAVQKIKK